MQYANYFNFINSRFTFFSLYTMSKEPKGLLPSKYLTQDINIELHDELLHLNNKIKLDKIVMCDRYVYNSLECIASEHNKKSKYLLDFKLGQIYLISNGGENLEKVSNIERIFGYKLLQFINSKMNNQLIHGEDSIPLKTFESSARRFKGEPTLNAHSASNDYCSSSPELFPSSCQQHDNCYDSGAPKGVCDDGFLLNMKTEAIFLAGGDMEVYASLFLARAAYYEVVVHSDLAFVAFCLATPVVGYPECVGALATYLYDNLEHTDDTTGGTPTGDSSGGWMGGIQTGGFGGHVINWTCELWTFPNGKGGQYLMYRNCTYFYQ
jgi:hypothetical protein